MAYKLKCVKCHHTLTTHNAQDFLLCEYCDVRYPIISNIPILIDDLTSYLANRYSVGLQMMQLSTETTRKFIAKCMPPDYNDDLGATERRWAAIYAANPKSAAHDTVKNYMRKFAGDNILEMGCSVGTLQCEDAHQHNGMLVGVDISFPALIYAKRKYSNVIHVLADITKCQFDSHDVVVALNMLDVVEPHLLLERMTLHARRHIVLSSPYDYSRGDNTVKVPMNSIATREYIEQLGFEISDDTKQPSFVPWHIRINSRVSIKYLVDIIVAKKV